MAPSRTRPEFRFRSGSVPVPVECGPVPVPVRYRLIWPVPERVLKVAKKTVENRYSSKSESVEMLLFTKYNLRFLTFRYYLFNHIPITLFFCINI